MELNNTQHKSFLWHLDFEPFTWHTFMVSNVRYLLPKRTRRLGDAI